jgi:hypothetical protein
VQDENRQFFYNPMWSHFGERGPSPPGSYYYRSSSQVAYFWHFFDQVLLRPDLLDSCSDDDVRVITEVGGRSLLDCEGRPDARHGSDHLPLVVTLGTEKAVLSVQ